MARISECNSLQKCAPEHPHAPVGLHHLLQLALEQAAHAASLAAAGRPKAAGSAAELPLLLPRLLARRAELPLLLAGPAKLPRLLAGRPAHPAGLLAPSAILTVLLPLLLRGAAEPARLLLAVGSLLPLLGRLAVGGLALRRALPGKAAGAGSTLRSLAREPTWCSLRGLSGVALWRQYHALVRSGSLGMSQ